MLTPTYRHITHLVYWSSACEVVTHSGTTSVDRAALVPVPLHCSSVVLESCCAVLPFKLQLSFWPLPIILTVAFAVLSFFCMAEMLHEVAPICPISSIRHSFDCTPYGYGHATFLCCAKLVPFSQQRLENLAGAPVENAAEHRRDLARLRHAAPELGGDS